MWWEWKYSDSEKNCSALPCLHLNVLSRDQFPISYPSSLKSHTLNLSVLHM